MSQTTINNKPRTKTTTKARVLCVDDEPQILEGLSLHLHRGFEVHTASSAAEGLLILEDKGPFAVVLSDMRMPVMDGAAFLSRVRKQAPDTVRMLLTGHTDMESAISAVNEGQIFRFLTKPCPPDQLRTAFTAATEQNRLLTAERELLEQTLRGSIRALIDILSLSNPIAFGRALRIKKHVSEFTNALGLRDRWQIEVAALLSPIGAFSLPEETAEKYFKGKALNAEEKEMIDRMPQVTERLLGHIPRLEDVREILAKQLMRLDECPEGEELPLGSRMLKIVSDFDELESRGLPPQIVLDTMRGRNGYYDEEILLVFAELKGANAEQQEIMEIPLSAVRVGMTFVDDVRTTTGILLVARGYQVTRSFLEKVRNFRKGMVHEPLRVVAAPEE